MDLLRSVTMPLLRCLPAEVAHRLGVAFLKTSIGRYCFSYGLNLETTGMSSSIPGLNECPHPIGLAAGFDKNAEILQGLSQLGFSFIEVGTVTPQAQSGNTKPRLFRQDPYALINRMGFNNKGAAVIAARLKSSPLWKYPPIGVNIGKNRTTPLKQALDDYLLGIETFSSLADYLVINVSSPNTPKLRDLANKSFINELSRQAHNHLGKLWLKLDPDMKKKDFQSVVDVLMQQKWRGLILTNTHKVDDPHRGGLSGVPLKTLATNRLEWAWEVHKGQLPMIGVGGIFTGEDIWQKLIRGAVAVQIYTAFAYDGPRIVSRLIQELACVMKKHRVKQLSESIGSYYL